MSDEHESVAALKPKPEVESSSDVFPASVDQLKCERAQWLLYADHEYKEEMVIGPAELQRQRAELDQRRQDKKSLENETTNNMNSRLYSSRLVMRDAANELLCVLCDQWSLTTAAQAKHHQTVHSTTEQQHVHDQNKPLRSQKTSRSMPNGIEQINSIEPGSMKIDAETPKTISETQQAPPEEISADNTVNVKKPENKTRKQESSVCRTTMKYHTQLLTNCRLPNKTVSNIGSNNFNTFICNDCNNQFDTKQMLTQHLIASHNSVKDIYLRCKQCPFTSILKSFMKRHMALHDSKRLFSCNICGYRFNRKCHLQSHMNVKPTSKEYSCDDICDYKTNESCHLNSHVRTYGGLHVEGLEPDAFNISAKDGHCTCNLCGYTASMRDNFKRHMRKHTGEKPYSCTLCSYKCGVKGYLKEHMRFHTGEKPYACTLCPYKCVNSSHLKNHMKTHMGDNRYACTLCSYKCTDNRRLTKHMRKHTGEKPYACHLCSYKCTKSGYLKKHMRKHTGEKPYACS